MDNLRRDLTRLNLSDSIIENQLKRFEQDSSDTVEILSLVEREFDFLLIHGYDLFDEYNFNWSGLDIKLNYLQAELDKKLLVYVIEGYRLFLLNQRSN